MTCLFKVDYILVAEFDINEGSVLKQQYPEPTGEDESYLADLMLPDGAHLRETDWSIFLLNQNYPRGSANTEQKKDLLYAINLVRTKHDACAKRLFPLLLLALENYYRTPTTKSLEFLYNSLNSEDTSFIPSLNDFQKRILRFSMDVPVYSEIIDSSLSKSFVSSLNSDKALSETRQQQFDNYSNSYNTNIDRNLFQVTYTYLDVKLPIKIPLTCFSEEIGSPSVIKLISTFGPTSSSAIRINQHDLDLGSGLVHPVILLINAILTEKRIIFLGHNLSADEVSNYVLAAAIIGSGGGDVLKGLKHKLFPYSNLLSLDRLLSCPGYIAGVTNPAFEDKTDWWDILFNINTKKITISPSISKKAKSNKAAQNKDILTYNNDNNNRITSKASKKDVKSDKSLSHTQAFINDLFYAIDNHYSEIYVRAKFESYIRHFLFLAAVYEQINYGKYDLFYLPRTTALDKINSENIKSRFIHSDLDYVYSTRVKHKFINQTEIGYSKKNSYSQQTNSEINSIQSVIIGFIGTNLYYDFIEQVQYSRTHDPINTIDIHAMINRIQKTIDLKDEEVIAFFTSMHYTIKTDKQIEMLLSTLPLINTGLEPILSGMYHISDNVKFYATTLLKRIQADPVSKINL
ncbi:hypothetical protein BB561_004083 [Smittium simulii]|uniref:UDENN domain-containing protein n=1 Tax=Smittium simulii TaxID=133385 RepID=A0A2T9YI58_9FUNG|nr:hypothetical protein BB561_004083 [Smittium simulii]